MRRRSLLAAASALLAGGCLGASRERSGTAGDPTTSTGTPTTGTPAGSETATTTTTRSPGEVMPPSAECPPPWAGDAMLHCPIAGSETGPARMTATAATLSLPRDATRIALENRSETTLRSSEWAFRFYAWQDGAWHHVWRKSHNMSGRTVELPPGERRRWRIGASTTDPGKALAPWGSGDLTEFVLRFPPGTYAFGFPVTPEGEETSHIYSIPFSVAGDPLRLSPTDGFVDSFRRDGTLVVRTRTEREYDHSREVSLVADRLSSVPADAARLGLLELYNPGYSVRTGPDRGFVPTRIAVLSRDGFASAYAGGSLPSRFRVETVDTAEPPLGLDEGETLTVAYRGTAWRLTSEEGWSSGRRRIGAR